MAEIDDLFQMVANASANSKGNNFKDGRGVVVIRELLLKNLNDGPTFIAACKVVESASKGDVDPVTKEAVTPNAVGSNPSWPCKLKKHKSAPGNMKAMVLALLGLPETPEVNAKFPEALKRLLGKEQPARGMKIGFETYQQPIQGGPNAGKIITLVRWSHIKDGNDQKSIAERRAELDKTDPIPA